MMNSIIKKGFNRFPLVYPTDAFDEMIESLFSPIEKGWNVDRFFDHPSGYPTDLVEVSDKDGKVTGYKLDVALAGIPKENINLSVDGENLVLFVDKTSESDNKSTSYISRGISRRSMKTSYSLRGVDKKNIRAKLDGGMLKVELPLAEEAKPTKIEIG